MKLPQPRKIIAEKYVAGLSLLRAEEVQLNSLQMNLL